MSTNKYGGIRTESAAGKPAHDAEASAIETTRAVRELLATIKQQAEDIQWLRTGVVHYADVGGVPIYETLEGREARHKSEIERLNGLVRIANSDKHEAERANGSLGEELAYARKKIDDLKRQKDAIHERLSWYEKYRTEPSDELDSLRLRLTGSNEACETLRAKLEAAEQHIKVVTDAHEKTAHKLADVIKERDEARYNIETTASELSWTQATLSNSKGQAETSRNYAASLERQLDEERAKTAELERVRDQVIINARAMEESNKKFQRMYYAGQRVLIDKENEDLKAKLSELEQTLSIVRGDLATAERARLQTEDSASAWEVRATRGWEASASRITERLLQQDLGAAVHRATRAERKAAAANKELEATRKRMTDLVEKYEAVCEQAIDCRTIYMHSATSAKMHVEFDELKRLIAVARQG